MVSFLYWQSLDYDSTVYWLVDTSASRVIRNVTLPWWEHKWFQVRRLDLTSEDCVMTTADSFLIVKLNCCKLALIFLSFSVDSYLIPGRFDETVIEERRQCAEDLLQFSANIPALYNSKQLEDFFKVWCSFWNILYLFFFFLSY